MRDKRMAELQGRAMTNICQSKTLCKCEPQARLRNGDPEHGGGEERDLGR